MPDEAPEIKARKMIFAEEYRVDRNATRAAIRAGYAKKAAHDAGSRLLKDTEVAAYIAEMDEKAVKALNITPERILREYALIAFSDLGDFAEWGGGNAMLLKDSKALGEKRRAILSVTETPTDAGVKQSIKLHSKEKALEILAKYAGLLKDAEDEDTRRVIQVVLKDYRGKK